MVKILLFCWFTSSTYCVYCQDLQAKSDSIISFEYPKLDYEINDFDIVNGFPIVPIYNGLYAAGFNSWVKELEGDFILSLCRSITDNGIFYLTLNDSFTTIRKRYPKIDSIPEKVLINYQSGFYKISAIGQDSLLLWGIQDDSVFSINYIFNDSIINFYSSKNPVNDVYAVQSHFVLIATDHEVFLFTDFAKPYQVIKTEHFIESITVSDNGSVYIATDAGIFKKEKDNTELILVANNIRGLLKSYQDKLFVLEPQNNRILLLQNH